jgi:CRISPR-associated protein Cas1
MHLLIENYGVRIEVEDEKFKISTDGAVRFVSPLKLGSISLLKPCTITSAALALAAASQVPVLIFGKNGKVQAWVWSHQYGTIADIRVKQAFFTKSPGAPQWVAQLISRKLTGQLQNLQWLAGRIMSRKEEILLAAGRIKNLAETLHATASIEQIRALEAQASKQYWEMVAASLANYISIPGRVKRGAEDPFNICLNYMYGILYGQIEASLLMAGADPYMGLMHINRHARPALAFDHIEPFRPWIDKLVMQLFMHQFGDEKNFEESPEKKYQLSAEGRKTLINTYFSFMEQRNYLEGKRIKNKDHLHHLSGELVATLKNFTLP